MSRIYANENYPSAVVDYLRILGHDVLTTNEAGKSNQRIPDEDVLSFAIAEKRAVLTFNRKDFFRLHRLNPIHAGIIALFYPKDYPPILAKYLAFHLLPWQIPEGNLRKYYHLRLAKHKRGLPPFG